MNCHKLSFFKLFDEQDWVAVNKSDNAGALINIEYVIIYLINVRF